MAGIVVDARDLERLSVGARKELLALIGVHAPSVEELDSSDSGWNPEGDHPYPLSLREAKALVRGLSESSRGMLRLFCKNSDGNIGRVTVRELLETTGHADAEHLQKAISGITRRLRTVTGHREAWLLDWENEWDEERQVYFRSEYFITSPSIRSLSQALGNEPVQNVK